MLKPILAAAALMLTLVAPLAAQAQAPAADSKAPAAASQPNSPPPAAGAATAPAAAAPTAAANDDCMKAAFDLADAAEKKNLPEPSLDKLDTMFTSMEQHCNAKQYPEAQAKAAEIKTFIDGVKKE